jgi:hypothetical protein
MPNVCVCMCVRARARMCVCVCVRALEVSRVCVPPRWLPAVRQRWRHALHDADAHLWMCHDQIRLALRLEACGGVCGEDIGPYWHDGKARENCRPGMLRSGDLLAERMGGAGRALRMAAMTGAAVVAGEGAGVTVIAGKMGRS